MKILNLLLLFSFLGFSLNAQIDSLKEYESSKKYQEKLNKEYGSFASSPLDSIDLAHFDVLPFFPISTNFIVEASLEKFKKKQVEVFQTSTSRLPKYNIYGMLYFEINEKDLELTVYQSPNFKNEGDYKDYLFLPFTDLTNGETSYGGGRYLDFRIPKNKEVVLLNFNKAYNPYCAYSDKYSCPVPPRNNFLDLEIEAGVMLLEQH